MPFVRFPPNIEKHQDGHANCIKSYPNPNLAVSKEHSPTRTGDLTVTKVLNVSNRSTVYLGHFDETPDNHVVLKVGKFDTILREARRYIALVALQGQVIPDMIALLRGETEGKLESSFCSILALQSTFHSTNSFILSGTWLQRAFFCVESSYIRVEG